MFANILVPLDGSALSEHALPMAQHLARSSDTALHLLQVISLRPELDALRGSGSESVTVLATTWKSRRSGPHGRGSGIRCRVAVSDSTVATSAVTQARYRPGPDPAGAWSAGDPHALGLLAVAT